MEVILSQFIRALVDSELMPAEEIEAFTRNLPPDKKPRDGRALAQELIRRGKLTKFQAQAVYQGKTKGLIMGEYVVLDRIGEGGMGQVYKAKHRVMERIVALKTLPSSATNLDNAVRRFQREVKVAARLSHRNIVTAHDAGEARGIRFLVMEYVDGDDLSTLVKKQGRLPVRAALNYILQAAKGLEYAHNHNVIHRDIKPSNLVLDSEGTVKILDMGLARLSEMVGPTDSTAEETLTSSGEVMGTINYMSPEQAENAKGIDHRADIYSLGCTLFSLLTGRSIYSGNTAVELLLAHREAPIPALVDQRPDVPPHLEAVFRKMVAKRPDDRYSSMSAVIAELEKLDAPQPPPLPGIAGLGEATMVTGPVADHQDTLAEESLPLDLPVVAPVDGIKRSHLKPTLKQRILIGLLIGLGLLALLLFAFLRKPATPDGTLIVEHDEPGTNAAASNVVSKPPPPVLNPDTVPTLISEHHPPLAIAPFSPEEAKQHQERWAKHLGLPVVETNSIGIQFKLIPAGEFLMGSPADDPDQEGDEAPQHRVRITKPFYLGIHEVTQEQYEQVMGANPSQFKGPTRPVEQVSWEEATEFCRKLSATDAQYDYRLPTEAEWEHACRARTTTRYSCGDNLDPACAWFDVNSSSQTHPVGEKRANGWGLYDMHGNVWEWCQDWYGDYYGGSPSEDPPGSSTGSYRVIRGGSWLNDASGCRSAIRYNFSPDSRYDSLGFRVALVPAE